MPSKENPPRVRLALRVGVTGKRELPHSPSTRALLEEHVSEVLDLVKLAAGKTPPRERQYLDAEPDLRFVSPLAWGADQLCANVARKAGFRLECPLPFPRAEYEKDFEDADDDGEWLRDFHRLLAEATNVLELDGTREVDGTGETAYLAVGRTVLAHVDVLISIWDGEDEVKIGGTSHITKEALAAGIPVVWIHATHPKEHRPTLLIGRDHLANDEAVLSSCSCSSITSWPLQSPSTQSCPTSSPSGVLVGKGGSPTTCSNR